MKNLVCGTVVVSLFVSGCDVQSNQTSSNVSRESEQYTVDDELPPEIQAAIDEEERVLTQLQLQSSESSLKSAIEVAKSTDPNIKSAQYDVDENGQPVVRVLRENNESGDLESAIVPLVVGALAGAAVSSMASTLLKAPPESYSKYECKEDCNRTGSSGWIAYNRAQASARVSEPGYTPRFSATLKQNQSVLSSRSSGVFRGASSRAGGYSSGFGG